MNFSKYKLQTYLSEDATAEVNTETSSQKATDSALMKNDRRAVKMSSKQQNFSQSQGTAMKNKMQYSSFDAEALRKEKETIKMMENQKSDWRRDLQEKVVDGQERENHPYVTVMPTGDENLIQAIKQMGKEVKNKKDKVMGEEADMTGAPSIKDAKPEKETKVKYDKHMKVHAPNIKKEEVEDLQEKKKKGCKDGYYRDEDGDCVTKKKKKSSSTIIMGRGWGHGHHHHDDDDDNDGGSDDIGGGGDGGDGGGMGEMFDALGDMLIQEMNLRDAQKAGMTKGSPKTPVDHAKLNAKRVAGYVPPKTSDKDRAKD